MHCVGLCHDKVMVISPSDVCNQRSDNYLCNGLSLYWKWGNITLFQKLWLTCYTVYEKSDSLGFTGDKGMFVVYCGSKPQDVKDLMVAGEDGQGWNTDLEFWRVVPRAEGKMSHG